MRILQGTIDGVNRVFTVPTDFKTGTVKVFTSLLQWETSVTELPGNQIELCHPPCEGDLLYAYYVSL